jgi:5-methylcytosine-specific restriction endonuclease McrA
MTPPAYLRYLHSPHWQEKREQLMVLVGASCEFCGSPDDLNVHHRTYENLGNESLSELAVLCKDCHADWHAGLLPLLESVIEDRRRRLPAEPRTTVEWWWL